MRRKLSLHRANAVTIDLHRDPSLRESAAYAIFGSRKAKLLLPSSSDRSRYTATRNLPSDNPVHAVKTMEATLSPPPKLNPRQNRRRFRRTSKPALCFTVYWEADYGKRTEIRLIDSSLAFLDVQHLQTLIVGRSDYPKRTYVIINVVSPSTHRVSVNLQPYYKLMRWHLSMEPDSYASDSLNHGMLATTVDSLRRQDHRLLDLPPQFAEAVRGVPGYKVDSNTLRLVHRAGPSTFHASEFIDTIHAEIHEIEEYSRQERVTPSDPDAAKRALHHKRSTRRKVLLGEHLLELTECLPSLNEFIHESMDASLTNAGDRSLFGLHSLDSKLLVGFRPKKHQHEWCAAYNGDPTTLPDVLIGYTIEIQPLKPNPPWTAPILSVVARSDEKLIVRTPPRNKAYPYFYDR